MRFRGVRDQSIRCAGSPGGDRRPWGALRPRADRRSGRPRADPSGGGGRSCLGRLGRSAAAASGGGGHAQRARRPAERRRRHLARDRLRHPRGHEGVRHEAASGSSQPAPRRRFPGGHERRHRTWPADLRDSADARGGQNLDPVRGAGRDHSLRPRPGGDQGVVPPDGRGAGGLVSRGGARPARLGRVGQADRGAVRLPLVRARGLRDHGCPGRPAGPPGWQQHGGPGRDRGRRFDGAIDHGAVRQRARRPEDLDAVPARALRQRGSVERPACSTSTT